MKQPKEQKIKIKIGGKEGTEISEHEISAYVFDECPGLAVHVEHGLTESKEFVMVFDEANNRFIYGITHIDSGHTVLNDFTCLPEAFKYLEHLKDTGIDFTKSIDELQKDDEAKEKLAKVKHDNFMYRISSSQMPFCVCAKFDNDDQ